MWRSWLAVSVLFALSSPGAAQSTDIPALLADATAGAVEAQVALALAYHRGDGGVVQNYEQAARWAEQAAQQGDPVAQNLLGRYAYAGFGVAKDPAAALRWLRAAADQGDAQHQFDLGTALETAADGTADLQAAVAAYEAAVLQGHIDAHVSLGVLAQEGRGVPKDYDRAFKLYEVAAKTGHLRALNNLGLLYVRGHGVAQDYTHAATLFKEAADQGLKPAMRNLGVLYENAFGVPLDEGRAVELYRLAAGASAHATSDEAYQRGSLIYDSRLQAPDGDRDQLLLQSRSGDPVAQFQLGWALMQGPSPAFADMMRAADLFGAAARAGHAPAMVNLGVLYFKGQGRAQDYVLGHTWLTLASRSGLPQAQEVLQAYAVLLTPEQINEAQQRAVLAVESVGKVR